MKDLKNQTIIVQGLEQDNSDIKSESFNLYLALSKICRVIYISPPSKKNTFDFLGKSHKPISKVPSRVLWEDTTIQISSLLIEDFHLFWVACKTPMPNSFFSSKKTIAKDITNTYKSIWNSIAEYAKETSLSSFNLINENVNFQPENMTPSKSIFRLSNDMHISELKKNLNVINGYNLYISSNKEQHALLNTVGYNSKIFSKGFNFAHFSKRGHKYTPMSITKPSVLYIGDVDTKLDLWLIEKIARSCPHFHFNFVGKVKINHRQQDRLESFDNIFFYENESFDNIPNWIHESELCWIPYHKEYTLDSTTINMYLAAAKPILSTSTPTINDFEEVITIFTNEKSFIENSRLQMFIEDNTQKENRINVAINNNWENKAKAILEEIIEPQEENIEELLNLVC